MKMISRPCLLWVFVLLPFLGDGQNCLDPSQLCFNPIPGNNTQFDSTNNVNGLDFYPLDCFVGQNGVLYEIQTIAPGDLTIQVANIVCDSIGNPDYGDGLHIALFQAPDPCVPGVSVEHGCDSGQGLLELDFVAADSAEVFYLAVMGSLGDAFPAQCGYSVQIGGESVEFQFGATPEYTITQGDSQILETSGDLDEYQWSPSETLDSDTVSNPTATPPVSTTYLLMGEVAGCPVEAEVFVEVIPDIRAANLITPNGDDINDRWIISGLALFPNADVRLFSRWGQQVFRSVGYPIGQEWDGTFGGKRVPAGTYYYVIEKNVPGEETEPVTGSVAVVY